MAPEVYENHKYDPQAADIWSLAIIFACMSLRRFPWKAPRLSDNSYKLFAAEPDPGTPSLDGRRASHHHHQHHEHGATSEQDTRRNSEASYSSYSTTNPEIIKGPYRLLRLLPRDTRMIIGRMLEINPRKRATLADMLADPWVTTTPVCRQIEHGQVIKATGHTHILEAGSPETPKK